MVTTSEPQAPVRGRRTRIGLDIGASGVRAVELTGKPDGYVVTCAACCERPRISGDKIVQHPPEAPGSPDPRLLAQHIENCLRQTGFRGKAVAVALAPPDVEFHTLELPAATLRAGEHDVAQIIHFEVERLMTQPLTHDGRPATRGGETASSVKDRPQAGVETRHWRLPETLDAAKEAASRPAPNAIGAGAAHEVIKRTIEACSRAGLTCSTLDTTATALSRFGAVLKDRPPDQIWGVLDVGARQTRLVLCLADTPVLVRTAGAGSRAWTQRIADALQVSIQAAEIHKRDHGIALTGRHLRAPTDDGSRSELASLILGALRADLNDLAAEVKRSYEYVLSCYPGNQAADLILCGGGSRLHNLPEFLGNTLGISVLRASSYLERESCRLSRRAGSEPNAPLEILAVAVGLAIAE